MRIVKGRLISVNNKNRKFGSAKNYISIQVEDSNGRNERCLLFTKAEIARAEERAEKNIEDLTKKNFFTKLFD
ncbi:hypothetical protein [Lutibacter sp.]|uniref:hypothetical protein n=1 Tax=Lutibacter sp. TaxID=1925666 RepID=UPI0034A04180